MKRLALLVVLLVPLAVMGQQYVMSRQFKSAQDLPVTFDSTADSTIGSGNIYLGDVTGYRNICGKVYLSEPLDSILGIGGDDSGWIWIYIDRLGESLLLDSAVAGALPCSLRVCAIDTLANGIDLDSALIGDLRIGWATYDSCSDSTFTRNYQATWDIRVTR